MQPDRTALCLVATCCALGSPLTGGPALADEPTLVPFTSEMGLVVVPVRVNGSEELRCILDTGMPEGVFLFDDDGPKSPEIEYLGQAQVRGAGGGTSPAQFAMGATMEFAGGTFENVRVIAMEERMEGIDARVDGIIGWTVFDRHLITIDHDAGVVEVRDPEAFDRGELDPDGFGTAVPISIVGQFPRAEIAVTGPNGVAHKVEAMIDTGKRSSLSLVGESEVLPKTTTHGVIGAGAGGEFTGFRGRIPGVEFGGVDFESVVVEYPDEDSGAASDRSTLGTGIMRRCRVTFDYAHERLFVDPGPTVADPFEANMAGLRLRVFDADRVEVLGVRDGTAGAEAGIEAGDYILAVDGRAVEAMTWRELDGMFEQDGAVREVRVRRGNEERTISVTLRREI